MTQGRAYTVFADVDETLIVGKSMVELLRLHLRRRFCDDGERRYRRILERFRAKAAAGTPREDLNRDYFRLYEGESVSWVQQLGEEWFAGRHAAGTLYDEETRLELAGHQLAGAGVVLVSGSFKPCLAPIARSIGAVEVLCGEPQIRDGRYTGEIDTPVIGAGKRDAVLRYLARNPGILPANCHAYGDDPSDVPMLQCVGHPHLVTPAAAPQRPPRPRPPG